MNAKFTELYLQSMGQYGAVGNAGTTAQTGPFVAIQFVTSGAFTALSGRGMSGLTGITFPAQFTLLGQIDSYTLTSGTVVHYIGSTSSTG